MVQRWSWLWVPVVLLALLTLGFLAAAVPGADAQPVASLALSSAPSPSATPAPDRTPLSVLQVVPTPSTWQPPQNISNDPRVSQRPAIAIDLSRILHVLWDDYSLALGGSDNRIVYTRKPAALGTSWSAPEDISQDPGDAIDPHIQSDPVLATIHAVWGSDRVIRDERKPGETSWEPPVEIGEPGQTPALAIEPNGTGVVHFVWEGQGPGRDGEIIWTRVKPDGSPAISENVSRTEGDSSEPAIAVDQYGFVHVVWTELMRTQSDPPTFVSRVFYSFRHLDSTIWSTPAAVFNGRTPSLSVDSNGTLHLAFVADGVSGNPDVYYASKPRNGNWSGQENVSNTAGFSDNPVVKAFIGREARVVVNVVWMDMDPGNAEIFHSARFAGEPWSPRENISNTSPDGASLRPSFTVDGLEFLHVLWEDNRTATGTTDIFYSTNVFVPSPTPTPSPTPSPTPTPAAVLSLSASQLNFFIAPDDPNLVRSQNVDIVNAGGTPLTWSASESAPWLMVSPLSSTTPVPAGGRQTLAVTVDRSAAGLGEHRAIVGITAPGAVGSPQLLTVVLRVGPIPAQLFFPVVGSGMGTGGW